MAHHLIVLTVLSLILGVFDSVSGAVTIESLVKQHGYPFETHRVTTPDGYILTLHRVPNSGPVVFIMHGVMCSSVDFAALGPNKSLISILYAAGFDIWLGNARGNNYSRNHVSLNADSESGKFWDFDWHEIGTIDLPTMIGYVQKQTGAKKITYIGHSQGTTAFLVASSLIPGFNNIIESAHLLSPVAYMSNLDSPFVKSSAPGLGDPYLQPSALDQIGRHEFKPSKILIDQAAPAMCNLSLPTSILCYNGIFLAAGLNLYTVEPRILSIVQEISPSGTATKQFLHYMQEFLSGEFRQYDYGQAINMERYGQSEPPNYPLDKINSPVHLYYGANDLVVGVKDVEKLMGKLKTLASAYRIPNEFDHMSFLFNGNANNLVYNPLLANILSHKKKPSGGISTQEKKKPSGGILSTVLGLLKPLL